MTSKSIAERLGRTGLCVCPGFLSQRTLLSIADDFDRVQEAGQLRRADVGRGPIQKTDSPIRTDHTYWLERETQNKTRNLIWRRLDLLQLALNRKLFLGLTEFEGHYAAYSEGGYYHRHKDCIRGSSGRRVTFVLYLNRNWQLADGGALRIYASDQAGVETSTDVNPVGGTMVCFLSAESDHEVLLNHKARHSLTGWFKTTR